MDRYEKLANAIILQAVKDYRDALNTLWRNTNKVSANAVNFEVGRFFRSSWYTVLTSVDGEMLIRKLQEEASE